MVYYRIRYLSHDGNYYFVGGTRANGEPIWVAERDHAATFSTKNAAVRMAQRLTQDGYDVEIV